MQHPITLQRRSELARVIECIEAMCDNQEQGTRLPSLPELMQACHASERTVLSSLDELQRRGRVVRRVGSGTYVSENYNGTEATVVDRRLKLLGEPFAALVGRGSCKSITVVASHDNSFFTQGVEIVYDIASRLGYPVSYEPPQMDRIGSLCERLTVNSQPGFIVFGSANIDICRRIHAAGHRVILIGGSGPGGRQEFPWVDVDQFAGGYLAMEYLIGLGHRRVAVIGVTALGRLGGNESAVREAAARGISVDFSFVSPEGFEAWQRNVALARDYLSSPDRPTGLCLWNDHDAVIMLTLLQSIGIRVPEDVSIVGWDNVREGQRVLPALTTVDSKLEERIKIALDLLIDPVSYGRLCVSVVEPELVVRASTARPKG